MTKPHWTEEEAARYTIRTNTAYAGVPLEDLEARLGPDPLLHAASKAFPDGAVAAGGYPAAWLGRAEKMPDDLDVFFTSEEAFRGTMAVMANPPGDHPVLAGYAQDPVEDLDAAKYVVFRKEGHPNVQLVKLAWYEDADHVVDTFDFTASQVGVGSGAVRFHPLAPYDIVRRRLVLHGMRFPGSTLRRMMKYVTKKGYEACNGFLEGLAAECHRVLTEDPTRNAPQHMYLD